MSDQCACCHGTNWFQCRCDDDCEVGRRRIAEGRDPADVEGDPEPAASPVVAPTDESGGAPPGAREGGDDHGA